jgi:hypothetical protein
MDDGSGAESGLGDVLPLGQDAWVIGDGSVVVTNITRRKEYGVPK